MVTGLHDAGLKVIVDIVPNHSSNRHPWFVEALAAGAGSPERDHYIFRNGPGPDRDRPPNDWQWLLGGSAWEARRRRTVLLPLLRSRSNPTSTGRTTRCGPTSAPTMRFWSDRGVDGFRIDVAHGLRKDMSEPYARGARSRT